MPPKFARRQSTRFMRTFQPEDTKSARPTEPGPITEPSASQPTRRNPARSQPAVSYGLDASDTTSEKSSVYSDEDEEEDPEADDLDDFIDDTFEDADYVDDLGSVSGGSDTSDIEPLGPTQKRAAPNPQAMKSTVPQTITAPTQRQTVPRPTAVRLHVPQAVTAPVPSSVPGPSAAQVSSPAHIPTTSSNTLSTASTVVRVLLEAHGQAFLRCALDHTPDTAAKLEDDIAKTSQAVVEFLERTISQVQQASNKVDKELVRRFELAKQNVEEMREEIVDKSREIAKRDIESKVKEQELEGYKERCFAAERDTVMLEARLVNMEQEAEAKRKRVEESVNKASKRASLGDVVSK